MRTLIVATALLAFLLLPINEAQARCGRWKSLEDKVAAAAVVFAGTAISADNTLQSRSVTTFKVEKLWKGKVTSEIVVFSEAGLYTSHFVVGEKYIVFAGGKDPFTTSICWGNTGYSEKLAEKLGKAQPL